MSDFLASMASSSRLRAMRARSGSGVVDLEARIASARPPLQLEMSGFDLIAEAKLASPADGPLVDGDDSQTSAVALARELAGARPAALSVLTEPTRFAGALAHLATIAGAIEIPVMRKDFLVDPIQVLEARAAGASGVLLIARLVELGLLAEMTDLALDLGMFALIEVFDAGDIELASAVFDREVLVGVNARNLADLSVDRSRHRDLAPLVPRHLPAVAESGLMTPLDVASVAGLGYRLALVGTSLATSATPGAATHRMIEAGRDAVRSRT